MSTMPGRTIGPARPEVVTDGFPKARPGWFERAASGDHKSVGVLYIGAALSFLVIALTELVLMRVQLIVPENTLIPAEIFNQLMSTSGVAAIVLFGIPLAIGLFTYLVPLQIGARGLALPHVAALGFWMYIAGGVGLYASFLYRPPDAGFNSLPPLSDIVFAPTHGVDAWIMGVGLASIGFALFAISMLATLRTARAPGMAWRRMPLFSWAAAVSSWVLLVLGPVMIAACTMLFIDRNFSGVFFDPGEGGSPILWQHLSWAFFTGAYTVLLLFAFGTISEILPTFSGKPSFSHRTIAACLVAVGVLGPLAWMENMYSAPLPIGWAIFAMAVAVALVVPVGLLILNWLATLWGGSLRMRPPLLFALGAISTISFGLAGRLGHAVIPVGWMLDNTTSAQADTLYAVVGAGLFGGFAALYYWFPKLTGRIMSDGLARASFWLMLLGVQATAIPLALAGLDGQPVDIYKYYDVGSLDTYNLIASIGMFVLALGAVLTLVNVARSAHHGVEVGADPWGGSTLEWFALSPPPPHNFDLVPDVRSEEPLRDIRDAVRSRTESWTPASPSSDRATADANRST